MKTQTAIDLAKTAKALADLLGITPGAISQWGEDVPDARTWQLRCIKPEWFSDLSHLAPTEKAASHA